MNIITGEQAKKHLREYLIYNKRATCKCGVPITVSNFTVAETEKEINGADVPTLEFFCSEQCAHEWLDNVESKKQAV